MLLAKRSSPPSEVSTLAPREVESETGDVATHSALATLRDAVLEIERARGDRADANPVAWKTLAAERWSIVEHFEAGGTHYVLARRNEPWVRGLAALTERERHVIARLALGHTMKLVAYELGIAYSTVRVLVARACAKLGVESSKQLLAKLANRTSR